MSSLLTVAAFGLGLLRRRVGGPAGASADGVFDFLDRRRNPVARRLERRPTRGGGLGLVVKRRVEAGPGQAFLRGLGAIHRAVEAGSDDTLGAARSKDRGVA